MQDDAPGASNGLPEINRFWEARSSFGRKPLFSSPDDLWTACLEYFEWNAANPLYAVQVSFFKGKAVRENVPKMRAMTIMGLCNFLGCTERTWSNYRALEHFFPVVSQVEQIIRQQKFEGASADLLNPNIIARDLGLADKRDLTSSDGTMTPQVTTFALPDNGRGDRNEG